VNQKREHMRHVITAGQYQGHVVENLRPLDAEGYPGWTRVLRIVTYGTNRDIDVPTQWLKPLDAPTGKVHHMGKGYGSFPEVY
jgi:hypothetical protein